MRKDMYGEAQSQLESALRLNAAKAELQHTLGDVLALQGRANDAITQYRNALKIDPNFGPAHFSLGIILADQGKKCGGSRQFPKSRRKLRSRRSSTGASSDTETVGPVKRSADRLWPFSHFFPARSGRQ
jgi:tetratricopeptide (TPR) repeat protein